MSNKQFVSNNTYYEKHKIKLKILISLGQDTTEKQHREKQLELSTKLSEKAIEAMENGAVDKDLGMITPGSIASEEVNVVKQEVPSLDKLLITVKETKKTKLELDFKFPVANIPKLILFLNL